MPKIVHLSTWDRVGGAAIAAWRLHDGLLRRGGNSRMVSRFRVTDGEDVSLIDSPVLGISDLYHQRRVVPAMVPDGSYFTVETTRMRLNEHPWIAAADVVHLHWVSRFIGVEDVADLCAGGRTVFWTFHGEWAYTGGCHYVGKTDGGEVDWAGASQVSAHFRDVVRAELEKKRRLFGSARIHVIAPSRWIARQAAESGIFPPERIHVLPYGVDQAVYRRRSLPMEMDGVDLLFGCHNSNERRKGFKELCEALRICMGDPAFALAASEGRIRLRTFGGGVRPDDLPEMPVVHLGPLHDESLVAETYRSASAFVCPTLDDNLPNVVMESLACGCPVIGFNTGGLPDMVEDGVNGLLVSRGDVRGLADALRRFSLDASLRERVTVGACSRDLSCWSLDAQAEGALALYRRVLGERADGVPFPAAPPALAVDGAIIPEFGTEIAKVAVEEMAARAEATRTIAERREAKLSSELVKLRDRLAEAKRVANAEKEKSASRLAESLQRANRLEEELRRSRRTVPLRIRSWFSKRLSRLAGMFRRQH